MTQDPSVAIIDYGLGNLFSVKQACDHAEMDAQITRDREQIQAADGLILPGVGAFSRAMDALRDLELIDVITDAPASGKPLIGICLGAQLLVEESYEFGHHEGLGLVSGSVRRLDEAIDVGTEKVPHVGWERIVQDEYTDPSINGVNLLNGVADEEYLYFVHSYCIETDDQNVATATRYGNGEFCSAFVSGNIVGFQFHPERSGPEGLQIYDNIRRMLQERD